MARGGQSVATLTRGLVGALLFGCALAVPGAARAQTSHRTPSSGRTGPADDAVQPVITLERSACRGQCAEYRLAFFEDGQVVYDGVANVSKAGRWHGRLPRETVDQLVTEFRRLGFDTLAAKYPPGIAESPVATTSLRVGSKLKTVTHQESSPFPPAALSALEDRLDASVQSVSWVR